MSDRVPPRHVSFRGQVQAAALWLATDDALPRALRLWQPGDQLLQGEHGMVLRFHQPRAIHTRRSWGVVLVEHAGRLVSAPLADDELPPEPGGVWAVRGGLPLRLDPLVPVDLAPHLALGERIDDLVPLADPPAPIQRLAEVPAPFAEVVPVRAEPLSIDPRQLPASAPGRSWLDHGLRGVQSALHWLQRQGRSPEGSAPPAGAEGASRTGWLARADQWLARRLLESGLGDLVGQAHARYLRDLMERLQGEQISDDDLRRAIPLGGDAGLGETLAGLIPRGRDSLDFQRAGSGGAQGVVALQDQLMDRLRALYRRAAERLIADGRIDQAAYILGELLHEPLEAIALLEAHGHFRRAAELAEAKDLEPALIVRLWFLAGELSRAVDIARRTGAFASALERLHARDPEGARTLRMAMARTLARAGAHAAAVALMEDHGASPAALRAWREAAIQAGGEAGAAQLGALLLHHPEAWDAQVDALRAVFDAPRTGPRRALARRVVAADEATLRPVLARLLWRACRADQGDGRPWPAAEASALEQLGATIHHDRPRMTPPAARTLASRSQPVFLGIGAADRGQGPVHDAHRLADGRWLLARGEDGVELRGAQGRLHRRWEHPCHHLVPSDQGTVVLVTRRGSLSRLHRLRLDDGGIRAGWDGTLDAWADRCTDLWFVGSEGRLMAIDLASDTLRAVWSVDLGAPVTSLHVSADQLVAQAGGELWCYELPRIVLRQRLPVTDPRSGHEPSVVVPCGGPTPLARFALMSDGVHGQSPGGEVAMCTVLPRPPTARAGDDGWWALASGPEVAIGQVSQTTDPKMRLHLEGADRVGLRVQGKQVVICDDLGRVVSVSLQHDRVDQIRV